MKRNNGNNSRRVAQLQKTMALVKERVIGSTSRRRRRTRRNSGQNLTSGMRVSRQVTAPASAGLVLGSGNPRYVSREESVLVSNCEITTGLTVSTTVTSGVVQLAPFAVGSFLNGQAALYSKWRWRRLRFYYIPSCPTSTFGSVHLGLQYDSLDSAPSTLTAISGTYRYTTGPVWSGFQAANALSSPNSGVPSDAICVEVDVTRMSLPWYPYVTSTNFTAQGTTLLSSQNSLSPGRLVWVMADGPATPASAGRLYAQYTIELIEPLPSSLNQ